MLTRIYGTAFFKQKDLEPHLERIEQAKERDHRRLGPELGLFMLREEAPGMPFWLPNGTVLLRLIEAEVREQLQARLRRDQDAAGPRRGALAPLGPLGQLPGEHVLRRAPERDRDEGDRRFALKPMNCPGACLVFDSERHSYRDLPLRLAEFGDVSRYEREGVLHGLLRVRAFTQDDAHVYCTLDQVDRRGRLDLRGDRRALRALRLRRRAGRALDPPRRSRSAPTSSGSAPRARCARRSSARAATTTSARATGPSTGRRSTSTSPTRSGARGSAAPASSTSRCPERFDLAYQGEDNAEHRPVMIHRALLGSMERFAGILIEHYGGRFPVWLAPVQAAILPVTDRNNAYAERVAAELGEAGVRVRVDTRSESVGRKIRDAELAKVPFMLVVGDREEEAGTVSVRAHGETGAVAPGRAGRRRRTQRPPGVGARRGLARPCAGSLRTQVARAVYTSAQMRAPLPRAAAEAHVQIRLDLSSPLPRTPVA